MAAAIVPKPGAAEKGSPTVCLAGTSRSELSAPGHAVGRYLTHVLGHRVVCETDRHAKDAWLIVVDHSSFAGVAVQVADLRLFRATPGAQARRVVYIGAVAGDAAASASWLLVLDRWTVDLARLDELSPRVPPMA